MIHVLFFLCVPANAQIVSSDTSRVQQLSVLQLQQQMKGLQSGVPVLTSSPTIRGQSTFVGTANFSGSVNLMGTTTSTGSFTATGASTTTILSVTSNLPIRLSSHDVVGVFNDTFTVSDFPQGYSGFISSTAYFFSWKIQNVSGGTYCYSIHIGTGAANGTCDYGSHYAAADNGTGSYEDGGADNSRFGMVLHGTNAGTNCVLNGGTTEGTMDIYSIMGSSNTWGSFGGGRFQSSNGNTSLFMAVGKWIGLRPATQLCITGGTSSIYAAAPSQSLKFNAHFELWYKGSNK